MTNKTPEERLDFLNSFIYRTQLSKDGNNVSIWCPFCQHKNKAKLKLVIHLEKCFYHCWICDKKGADVSYVVSKIDHTKVEKAKTYFKKPYNKKFDIGINIDSLFNESYDLEEEERVEIPTGFKLLANNFNSRNPDVRAVFNYALKRGVTKHKLWYMRLGYSLDDEFRRMLIIPSFDKHGKINFYTGRRIDVDTHSGIKYKNSSNSKNNVVFNEVNLDWKKELTIVEGPLDLLKTDDNATCLLGSSLTKKMLLFQRIVENKTDVVLALDSDVYQKTLRIARMLYEYDINVKIADTRGYSDVGDMTISEVEDIIKNASKFEKNDLLLSRIAMI